MPIRWNLRINYVAWVKKNGCAYFLALQSLHILVYTMDMFIVLHPE